MDITCRRI